LLGLGLAGGLTPSPSALIVLLASTAAGHPWVGVAAVVAFGIGMAGTLATVGLVIGLAGDRIRLGLFERRGLTRLADLTRRWAGLAVVAAGLLFLVRAGI
jgi:ABC-type nickel/cobalt efflux system permease component RcnA